MELTTQVREKLGKKAKTLKYERRIPAVIFGKGVVSDPISVDLVEFGKVYSQTGETSLIDLALNNEKVKVLIRSVQMDPVLGTPIHIGFYKVNLKEKIRADIPVILEGENKNLLIKGGQALALLILDTVTVEALPADLPRDFRVDVSALEEIGDGITVGELNYNKEKVEIPDYDDDELVVKLDFAEMREEVTEEVTEEEALAKVEATEELSEEEKLAKEAEKKDKVDRD